MLSRVFADIVLSLHFAFILFGLFGGFLVLYKRRVVWLHAPVVLWSSLVNLAGWICPLTPLENIFRSAAGQSGYGGGFVEHYIAPLIYPGGMPRTLELVAGISVLAWNSFVYLFVVFRLRRR
jgi:hypothetical protein